MDSRELIHLAIIDGQNDFTDLPEDYCPIDPASGLRLQPALPVPGAHDDLLRAARLLNALRPRVARVIETFDTHFYHIATTAFWRGGDGSPVAPYTEILAQQVRAGQYQPAIGAHLEPALAYMDALEAAGKYTLRAWPVHCKAGTWGHNLHPRLLGAVSAWEASRGRFADIFLKGMNMFREHYSAVRAEVIDPNDPATDVNHAFIRAFTGASTILFVGQAASHCVKGTVVDLADHLDPRTFILVSDCMSAVPGCQAQVDAFFAEMRAKGARVMTSREVIAQFTS